MILLLILAALLLVYARMEPAEADGAPSVAWWRGDTIEARASVGFCVCPSPLCMSDHQVYRPTREGGN